MTDQSPSIRVRAYSAQSAGARLELRDVDLPPLAAEEVEVRISHCGICKSDIDAIDGIYGPMYQYPLVAGHEGVGVISRLGSAVEHLEQGQRVGVGVYRSVCGSCAQCTSGASNLCAKNQLTFVGGASGAFAESVRLKGNCAIPIPDAISSEHAGPLMCASVTTFAPFVNLTVRPGQRVGVVGLGGLGHLALQWSHKFGCETFGISRGMQKQAHALALGANHYIDSAADSWVDGVRGELDYLLLTAAGSGFPWPDYLASLAPNGKLVLMGVSMEQIPVTCVDLIVGQKSIHGSAAGSSSVALEMLAFAALHGVKPMVEVFPFSRVNDAIDRVRDNAVRFRAVLAHDD